MEPINTACCVNVEQLT